MMCQRREPAVFLHAHGQLNGLSRLLVERHLETCDSCRAKWARWVTEKDGLRRALAPPPLDYGDTQRMVELVGDQIRMDSRTPGSPAPAKATPRPKRRMAELAVVAAILALTVSAMAAFWSPGGIFSSGSIEPDCNLAMPSAEFIASEQANCGNSPANAPANSPAAAPKGEQCPTCGGNMPASAAAHAHSGAPTKK
jgi:anti-sigma factor RsiW